MKQASLLYLFKGSDYNREILLAEKKYGKAKGVWNGIGGKYDSEKDKSIEDTLIRETREEIGVTVSDFTKVAELSYTNTDLDEGHIIHTYTSYTWEGEIRETEEMRPEWFALSDIPFHKLWPVDQLWFPFVLKDGFLQANFLFREGENEPYDMTFIFRRS